MQRSLVLKLFRSVTCPHWTRHWLRTSLTVLGISLGVATVIGMANVSTSILSSFNHMVRTVAGSSDIEVRSPVGQVEEALIDRVLNVTGVESAAGVSDNFLLLPDYQNESLCVFGLDFLGSSIWRDQLPKDSILVPNKEEFIVAPDSIVLTEAFLSRSKLTLGSPLRVLTPNGVRTLQVRGVLTNAPIAALFDGAIGVMDLPAVQALLGREGRVDRIAVRLLPGTRPSEAADAIAAELGPSVEVGVSESRGREIERILFSLRGQLFTTSSLAVIVGAFIVYNTVAVSLQQRRRQFALLNTIGIQHRTVVVLCLAETLILAAGGVVLGFAGGNLLGSIASDVVGDAASQIWIRLAVERQVYSLPGAAIAAVVGVVTPLFAAAVALRATFRAPTVEALRPVSVEAGPIQNMSWLLLAGVILIASACLLVFAPRGLSFGPVVGLLIASQAVVYAGGAVLSPVVLAAAAAGLYRIAQRSRSLSFRLAAENLPRSPWRTAGTVATITVTLAMAVGVAGVVRSFERAVLQWVEHHFGADLFVGGGSQFRLLAGPPMDEKIGDSIVSTAGVVDVEPFRVMRVNMADRPVFLQGISVAERLRHGGLSMAEGDFEASIPALRAGTGALVSDNLAFRLGLRMGDRIEVPTPAGPREFRVEGTFIDYVASLDLGAVAVSRSQLGAVWGDRQANLFRVWLEDESQASAVRRRLLDRLGGGYYVATAGQFHDTIGSVLGRFFVATWALQLVAALVGVIGVVNAQLATVLDRNREIGMIRTIGVPEKAIVRSVVLECGIVGALGGLAGALIGVVVGAQFIGSGLPLATGWRMPFQVPLAAALGCTGIAMLVSAMAGYIPALAAAKLDVSQQSLD